MFILSGIPNKLTVYCKEKDKYILYNSDRYGFNNKDDLWDKYIKIILRRFFCK